MSILTNRPRPVSLIILLYYIILYYTSWHKFWHLNPSVGRGESAGKIFPTMLLHLWFFFNLICNRTMFWTSWILTYWPQGLGGGVCRQNICYHFAALVIYLNLICNMFMFWKSCILTLRPPVLAGGGGGLLAKYSLLCCCMCDSFYFDMQHDHILKKLNFEL